MQICSLGRVPAGQAHVRPSPPTPCKNVGSAYVGSNPTPATTQKRRSRTYAQPCDGEIDGTARSHGLFVIVGVFPPVRGLDAQAASRRWPMARQMRGEISGAQTRTQP